METHKPGVGALLIGVQELGLTNIRVFQADVIDVLTDCIPAASLAGVQIFFPDPWQKRRHFARRLIQPAFMDMMARVLMQDGTLHLATDWQDYAKTYDAGGDPAASFAMRRVRVNLAYVRLIGRLSVSLRCGHWMRARYSEIQLVRVG